MELSTLDKPVTDEELEQHSPAAPTASEWDYALFRHSLAYDRDDVQSDAYDCGHEMIEALNMGNLIEAGRIINSARLKTIARRAALELTGVVK